jgi:hypothetical protein
MNYFKVGLFFQDLARKTLILISYVIFLSIEILFGNITNIIELNSKVGLHLLYLARIIIFNTEFS